MKLISLCFLVLLVAGCNPFETKLPDQYRLDFPISTESPGPLLPWQVVVDTPVATQAIDTANIAIHQTGGKQTYYDDVSWSDRAPVLVQNAIIQSLQDSHRIQGVARREIGVKADYLIQSELRDFQAEETSGPFADQVHISLAVNLIDMMSRKIIASKTFEATTPTDSGAFLDVIAGFDSAAQQLTADIVPWVISTGMANPVKTYP